MSAPQLHNPRRVASQFEHCTALAGCLVPAPAWAAELAAR